jgi:hypothetical protein
MELESRPNRESRLIAAQAGCLRRSFAELNRTGCDLAALDKVAHVRLCHTGDGRHGVSADGRNLRNVERAT